MPNQPRASMDQGKINGLADTFESKGFKGSIIIWYPKPDYAEIISGHRSWTAFLIVGQRHKMEPPWDLIPCAVFTDIDEAKAFELAILYNEKREDLTLLELATSWDRLLTKYHFTPEVVAHDFETSVSTVYNTVSVLKEPAYILDAVAAEQLTLADVLGLRRIKDETQRIKVAHDLIEGVVAKSQLPEIASRLNRQSAVIQSIPDLKSLFDDPTEEKGINTHMDIYIPKDFTLYFTFGAAARIDWAQLPQRNILVSAYHILHRSGKLPMVLDMVNKRNLMDSLMIDSSGIIAMGIGDTDWFNRQPEIIDLANAVEANVVVMLDVLTKHHLLEKCKFTVADAQKITLRNALQMIDLKTKAKKCYVLQGNTDDEYEVCIKAYQDMGIFSDDQTIMSVGSRAGERRETTIARYAYCCRRIKEINPKLGIHAFGIGTPYTLVELYKQGISQADNQTPNILTQVNQWVDARTGEPAKGVRLADERISAMYNAQLIHNWASYFIGLSNEFKRQGYQSI